MLIARHPEGYTDSHGPFLSSQKKSAGTKMLQGIIKMKRKQIKIGSKN